MNRILFLLITVLFSFCFSGCSSLNAKAHVAPYPSASQYAPTDAKQVYVYYNQVPFRYEVIGEIDSSGNEAATWPDLEKQMSKKAAQIGGQGVLIQYKAAPELTRHHSGKLEIKSPAAGTTQNNTAATQNSGINNLLNSNVTFDPPRDEKVYTKEMRGLVIRFSEPTRS
ncbi:MAG: hypothetical protein HZC17_04935 [Candidatus Omnitrophica bacterium]|nr:hypothetical protein [Candidatus Omnitrophota bacterium]